MNKHYRQQTVLVYHRRGGTKTCSAPVNFKLRKRVFDQCGSDIEYFALRACWQLACCHEGFSSECERVYGLNKSIFMKIFTKY